MKVAMVLVCCIMPCIGLILGMILMRMGKKRKEGPYVAGQPSGQVLQSIGRVIALTSLLMGVATALALTFMDLPTRKTKIVAAVLAVTIQYFGALILIFVSSGMLQVDKRQRKEGEKKEDA